MNNFYPSRKSIPLGIAIWGFALIGFYFTYNFELLISSTLIYLIPTIIWIAIFLFIGFVWFGIGYTISNECLLIKIGGLALYKIWIKNITSIERSYSALSSPANSYKRIKIKYKGGQVLISPVKEKDFLSSLKKINPDLEILVKSK